MAKIRNVPAENLARDRRFRERGWKSYGQYRYWAPRLTDSEIRKLAETIGGPVEPERASSLMSIEANRIVNPRDVSRDPRDWQVRLLVAAGKIKK